MPQDPNLYGQPPPKKQKKSMPLTTSLDFTSQLTSLLSSSSSSTPHLSARPRPSKTSKTDALFSAKVKRKPGARQPNPDADASKLILKSPTTTEDDKAQHAAARKKMEEKARLYAAMKRGDYVPLREGEAEPLVDFDRKWAEAQAAGKPDESGSGSENEDNNHSSSSEEDTKKPEEEMVEYEDEFGRLRTATKSAYALYLRRQARGQHAASELESMSARPAAPAQIIFGETIQSEAFTVSDPDKMEELAAKRDRSATPPEARHYDAKEEIRNRGTGFYAFSGDKERREEEMRGLEEERKRTERVRKEREEERRRRREEVDRRRREVERKRREIGERNAGRMADEFLGRLEEKWAEGGFVPKIIGTGVGGGGETGTGGRIGIEGTGNKAATEVESGGAAAVTEVEGAGTGTADEAGAHTGTGEETGAGVTTGGVATGEEGPN